MNMLMIILLLVGVALALIEVFVPGGVLGTIGGVAIICGGVIGYREHGPAAGTLVLGATLALLAIGLFIEFRILPRTGVGRKLFLSAEISGTTTSADAGRSLVGRNGQAITALAPTGLVSIDGRRYEASSRSGFIEQGVPVVVRGADNFRIIVEKS